MLPEREKFYEHATQKLLSVIDKMKMDKMHRMRAKNLVLLFRDSFKLPNVKYAVFSPELSNEQIARLTYDSDAFCRVSSINFAVMMGGAPEWQLMYIDDLWTYGPHHYLKHIPSNTIFDLTYDQYTHAGIDVRYDLGRPIPFDYQKDSAAQSFANAIGLTSMLNATKQKD